MYSPKVGIEEHPPVGLPLPWSYELKEEEFRRLEPIEIYKRNKQIQRNDILQQKLDWIHLNFGAEGTGKTSLSVQDILEIDPKFADQNLSELPQVPFSVKQFKDFLSTWRTDDFYSGRPGVGILFDEGNLVANARKALSKESQEFVNLLTQIRSEYNFYIVFNFQSYRLAETYLKNDRCKSASRCFMNFDRKKLRHVSGQATFYNAPMVRQIKVNSTSRQIEFPAKGLFNHKFEPAKPFKLWRAINEKKYLHLLDTEETNKNKSGMEKRINRLNTLIQVAKLDNETEKIKTLSDELKGLLLKRGE